jgi:hypothetical protein
MQGSSLVASHMCLCVVCVVCALCACVCFCVSTPAAARLVRDTKQPRSPTRQRLHRGAAARACGHTLVGARHSRLRTSIANHAECGCICARLQLFTAATGGYVFHARSLSSHCAPMPSGDRGGDAFGWSLVQQRLLVRYSTLCPGLSSAPNIKCDDLNAFSRCACDDLLLMIQLEGVFCL